MKRAMSRTTQPAMPMMTAEDVLMRVLVMAKQQ